MQYILKEYKTARVSIYCDINKQGPVEHKRSHIEEHEAYPIALATAPRVFISLYYIDTLLLL
jgi:hypothetical protein